MPIDKKYQIGENTLDTDNIQKQVVMKDNKSSIEADATVSLLRQVSPYFLQHRDSLFVIHIEGDAIEHSSFQNLAKDLMLLSAVGIKIIVIFGAENQISSRLSKNKVVPQLIKGEVIFDSACMVHVREIIGSMRFSIESCFSYVRDGTPMRMGAATKITSGNFVAGKSRGIVEGTDMLFSGEIRSLDDDGMRGRLAEGEIVLIPPVGFAPSGELFNLDSLTLALEISTKLKSSKLIFVSKEKGVLHGDDIVRQISVAQAESEKSDRQLPGKLKDLLATGVRACRDGVGRVHFISYLIDGTILRELFTRDGVGTMMSDTPFDNLRAANQTDIVEILELIKPMQEQGLLLSRTYENLLEDLKDFIVIIREGTVVAAAALHQYEEFSQGEVACVAVHRDYRGDEFGDMLLSELELRAEKNKVNKLFVLTTQAVDWFKERGYVLGNKEDLPQARLDSYSDIRNSAILVKTINS